MRISKFGVAICLYLSLSAWSLPATDQASVAENETPTPPAFNVSNALPFDMGSGSALRFGIDPATISLESDRILRYVVIARSGDTVNAMYEGLRCSSDEYKVYAYFNPQTGWRKVTEPKWVSLSDGVNNKHALQFSRQGGCRDQSAQNSVDAVIRDLKQRTYTDRIR